MQFASVSHSIGTSGGNQGRRFLRDEFIMDLMGGHPGKDQLAQMRHPELHRVVAVAAVVLENGDPGLASLHIVMPTYSGPSSASSSANKGWLTRRLTSRGCDDSTQPNPTQPNEHRSRLRYRLLVLDIKYDGHNITM